jgi:N-methylhydantoinase A
MNAVASGGAKLGVDIGGTFTDFVLIKPNRAICTKKVLSTPDDYSRGVAIGIKELLSEEGLSGASVKQVVHGTTVVTNACIEYTGAKVGLITTKGFRDVLEITRGRMPTLYDFSWSRPLPLVPRHLRFEVDERIDKRGGILRPLDVDGTLAVIERLISLEVESVAVCLYNSPRNPVHEQKVAECLKQRAPHLSVSLSTKVMPLMKEYERTCETVVNAYVMPLVARYMQSLKKRLGSLGVTAPLFIMQSNGGMITAEACAEKPIEIVECGPAGGVVGAAYLAEKLGKKNLITLDLGGTTCKASIVEGGKFTRSAEYEVGAGIHMASRLRKGKGYVLRIPSIDIAEIGAGGGSIVWVDKGGLLNVGPRSAGASPGPACYDQGGEEPTLTDCHVVLGYLNPRYLLGGDFKLDPAKAYRAIEEKVAKPLGMDPIEAAHGAYRIANSNMNRAINAVSSERGRDPRKFVLLIFGGAGALHGAEVARGLGIREIIIAPYGGVFSAFGFLCADIERYDVQASSHLWDESTLNELNRIFRRMSKEALASSRRWGYGEATVQIERHVDLRYVQQASELSIPVPVGELSRKEIPLLRAAFDDEHERTFGHSFPDAPLEVMNLRIVAKMRAEKPFVAETVTRSLRAKEVPQTRKCYFGKGYGFVDAPVLKAEELGQRPRRGPLVLDAYDTTIVVPPGSKIARTRVGGMVIHLESQEA